MGFLERMLGNLMGGKFGGHHGGYRGDHRGGSKHGGYGRYPGYPQGNGPDGNAGHPCAESGSADARRALSLGLLCWAPTRRAASIPCATPGRV